MAGLGEVQEEQVHEIVSESVEEHEARAHGTAAADAGSAIESAADSAAPGPKPVPAELTRPGFWVAAFGVVATLVPAAATVISTEQVTAGAAILAGLATTGIAIYTWIERQRQKTSQESRLADRQNARNAVVQIGQTQAMGRLALAKERRGE